MKNKGRKHLAGIETITGSMNCKGYLTHITRPIKSMSSRKGISKFDKEAWSKRVRGYFKQELNNSEYES